MTPAKKRKPQRGSLQDRLVLLRGGLTQTDFAAALTEAKRRHRVAGNGGKRIDASRVSEWESGKIRLSEDSLRLFAFACNVSLDWLVLGVDASGAPSEEVVYRGQGMKAATLRTELVAEATRRVMRRVAEGGFDDLELREHGPSKEQVREALRGWEPDPDMLFAQVEQAAVASARSLAGSAAWEQSLRKLALQVERSMHAASKQPTRRAFQGLAQSVEYLLHGAQGLLDDSRFLRFTTEWNRPNRSSQMRNAKAAESAAKRIRKKERGQHATFRAALRSDMAENPDHYGTPKRARR